MEVITHVAVTAACASDEHATIPTLEALADRGQQPEPSLGGTMPQQPLSSIGVENPWYPEGGPGRHLKARLNSGEVLIGPLLCRIGQFPSPPR